MQISRHWRLNAQRYRLQGVRYEDGKVSLQARPTPTATQKQESLSNDARQQVKVATSAA